MLFNMLELHRCYGWWGLTDMKHQHYLSQNFWSSFVIGRTICLSLLSNVLGAFWKFFVSLFQMNDVCRLLSDKCAKMVFFYQNIKSHHLIHVQCTFQRFIICQCFSHCRLQECAFNSKCDLKLDLCTPVTVI